MDFLSEYTMDYNKDEIKIWNQNNDCTVYKVENYSGEGFMTSYQVFPGIAIIYNDFHMANCPSNPNVNIDIMEINHCRQGRFECEFHNGSYVYIEEGDLAVNMLSNRTKKACFPLEHYHGVSVVIDACKADKAVRSILGDVQIDVYKIRNRLCDKDTCFVMRATKSIDHIFSELYTAPSEVKKGYFKIKILELLLFLSVVDTSMCKEKKMYFQKKHVMKIKSIRNYLTEHLDQHFTLEQLSELYDIPISTLKVCFKGVYGASLYAYMRTFRMEKAAFLLKTTNHSVTEIAGKLGFINPSKFSSAFRDIIGVTPTEYRKVRLR